MLSSDKKRTTHESPEELIRICRDEGQDIISFTYNEPVIWFEYIMDVMAMTPDLHLVLVTNGLIDEEPLRELCRVADALNMDVKGFNEEFYVGIREAHLNDVLRSVCIVHEEGVHIKLTYLVIPRHNNSEDEVSAFYLWVRDTLGRDVPVHFTRFYPDNQMIDVGLTPVETVMRCSRTGIETSLDYVYAGNILDKETCNTYCHRCGATVIRRLDYRVDMDGLDGDRCAFCGARMNIIRRGGALKAP